MMTFSYNKVQRFSLWTESPVHMSDVAVWTAAGLCTSSLSFNRFLYTRLALLPPPSSTIPSQLVKAAGLLIMGVKWWKCRGWSGELTRAQLLSTHTHSVQLLLLDQLGSIYEIPSIEKDDTTCDHTSYSPEQDICQSLRPRITWWGTANHNVYWGNSPKTEISTYIVWGWNELIFRINKIHKNIS